MLPLHPHLTTTLLKACLQQFPLPGTTYTALKKKLKAVLKGEEKKKQFEI